MDITEIPRNDIAACKRYYKAKGFITPEDGEMLAMLQDDPSELARVSKRWKVKR